MTATRAEREKQSYDEHNSFRSRNRRLHGRLAHLRRSPNMQRGMAHFDDLLVRAAANADVLEIGCGNGWQCQRLLDRGPCTVHGMDISTSMLETAKGRETERLKFFEHDVHQDWPMKYDVIFGRAVLHHLDYRGALEKLYHNNLRPNGQMLFLEPLGENLLLRAYWRFGTSLHTPDERPFMHSDIEWMRQSFHQFRLYPYNYLSIPAAIISSYLFASPENALLRSCDRLDATLSETSFLAARYQSGIFHIRKSST